MYVRCRLYSIYLLINELFFFCCCMCVSVHVCYTHTHTLKYTHLHTRARAHTHTHTHTHACILRYLKHTHIRTHTTHTHTYAHTPHAHTHTHTHHTQTYKHLHDLHLQFAGTFCAAARSSVTPHTSSLSVTFCPPPNMYALGTAKYPPIKTRGGGNQEWPVLALCLNKSAVRSWRTHTHSFSHTHTHTHTHAHIITHINALTSIYILALELLPSSPSVTSCLRTCSCVDKGCVRVCIEF